MSGIAATALGLLTLFSAAAALHHTRRRWPSAPAVIGWAIAGALALFLVGAVLSGNILVSGDSPAADGADCRGVRTC